MSKLQVFKKNEAQLVCQFANKYFKLPTIIGVSLDSLEDAGVMVPDLSGTCDHVFDTTQDQTRSGDEMITVITRCIKCRFVKTNSH